jgi:peptidoglycan/LPS O-acetylase OafA/YrhL
MSIPVRKPKLSYPKYRPDIDGLRAVAVLAVVAFHAFPNWLKGGFIGLDIFFVISGYLISTIIFENLYKDTFSFSEFYTRRIRRIFPALIIVLVVCLIFGWFFLIANDYKQLGKHTAASAIFISNFIFWKEAGYFDSLSETKILLHLWSLGVEEQFYIVWPLLLWLSWKCKLNLLKITTVIAIFSFVLNLKGIKQDDIATFYSPQTRFWELLSGSLLAWVMLHKKEAFTNITEKINALLSHIDCNENRPRFFGGGGKGLVSALSFVGLLLLVLGFWKINQGLSFPGKWALVPVVGTLLLILAGAKTWINHTILSNKIAVWFGLISYPLYLWHWPLLTFARIIEKEAPSRTIRIAAVAISIALAWLTYKFVEHPLRFGNKGKGKFKVLVLVLVLLISIVGFLGHTIDKRNGLQSRPINQLNDGVNQALTYDFRKGFRAGECFIDVEDKKTNTFSRICGEKKSGIPSLLIWGDSHAASLYRGFESFAKRENLNLYQFTASICPPILDFYISKRKECISSNKFVYKEIERLKPDTIVLASYWALYDGTDGWENIDSDKLVATISKLKLLGIKNITIIGQLPVYSVRSPDMLYKKYFWSKVHTVTYKNFRPTARAADDNIRNIALTLGVNFISPLEILCGSSGCLISIPGDNITPLSFDYGHLTTNGSEFLVSKFLESKLIKAPN